MSSFLYVKKMKVNAFSQWRKQMTEDDVNAR